MRNIWQLELKLFNCILWTCFTPYYLRTISIEAYYGSIGRFFNRLRHLANAQNVVSIRSGDVYIILLFLHFSLYLPTLLHAFFALFMFVTIYVDYAKHIDTSCHFLEINYCGYNLNFLKLKLLIDGGTQVQNLHKIIVNLQFGTQRKSKHSKEQQKSVTLLGAMLMLLVIQLYRIVFSIEFNHSS